MKFEELHLHDATIASISYLWKDKELFVNGKCFSEDKGASVDFTLGFNGVTCVSLPHHEEWGSSSSINGTKFTAPAKYCIEMQSGDVITIEAAGFKFSA